MTGAQYIVESLIKRGVTDAFGIPGGVILPFLYAMDERKEELMPHLSYHEQCAGFAACGYAQASGKIGVAYATRGPGFTNLISAIADAYYDSLPVLFITAHSAPFPPEGMRVMADQEIDTCAMVRNITKKADRLDNVDCFADEFQQLCETALSGRRGPVFIDVSSKILLQELPNTETCINNDTTARGLERVDFIIDAIKNAKRPIILAGDGINQANARNLFHAFVLRAKIPVISSRFTHDILRDNSLYYGYIGSHGMRCANFILSKTDFILSLGNRLHFPTKSQTFGDVVNHAKIYRCEIDVTEFRREINNTINIHCDVSRLLQKLNDTDNDMGNHCDWIQVCKTLKKNLSSYDNNEAIASIMSILKDIPSHFSITNDVGNNEFWVSRACVNSGIKNRVYYSKSFGALGCGLGKAIGVYYATKQPIVCFVGDQGLQMNIQELQYIVQHHLPIIIVLINNFSSGMIKDREQSVYGKCVHTTKESGYQSPSFDKIAQCYGLHYFNINTNAGRLTRDLFYEYSYPMLIEIEVNENLVLTPSLPKGSKCDNMLPEIDIKLYEKLREL